MWKIIIILILVLYILNKISRVLFSVMGRPQSPPPPFGRQSNSGADATAKQTPKKGGIKGGEYVDYEEVK